MKQVLAELHSLINDLEDQGLTVEASSLQEVFVRVAQEADEDMDEKEDDLPKMVADVLAKHSVPEVIAEIANQMEDDKEDTQTMSFPAGDEPGGYAYRTREDIIDNYVSQLVHDERPTDEKIRSLFMRMNQDLKFHKQTSMGFSEFMELIKPNKTSLFSFGDDEMGESGSYLDIPDNVELKVVPGKASGEEIARVRQNIIQKYRMMRNTGSDDFKNDTKRAEAATEKLREKFPDQYITPITASEIFGTLNPNGTIRQDVVPFPEQTPEQRERILEESKRQIEDMDKFYAKYHPYTTAGPQTSR